MDYKNLLRDATEATPSASQRSQQVALTAQLNATFPQEPITLKGVSKWFERGSIPGKWLLRIAALRTPPLNLSTYA